MEYEASGKPFKIEVIMTNAGKKAMVEYWCDHQDCEITGNTPTQVHHIFGRGKRNGVNLETETFNLITITYDLHKDAEHVNVQSTANKIFTHKIHVYGQKWIDFADKVNHKTWMRYRETHKVPEPAFSFDVETRI